MPTLRPNVRVLGNDVIELQRQRRAKLDADLAAMNRQSRQDERNGMDMLVTVGLISLGILCTGVLLVWAAEAGVW